MLFSKSAKSLQLSLNELIPKLKATRYTVSSAAYSKARLKLKHTAFIKLNEEAVVQTMYEGGDYRTYKGLRVLAIDGSKVLLPTTSEIEAEFGSQAYGSQRPNVHGKHCYALASVLYDVMNKVALDAQLLPCNTYEVEAAVEALQHIRTGDLVIYDRGYCSFRMLALASQTEGEFLVRCQSKSFLVARDMLGGGETDDVTVTITAPQKFREDPRNRHLPHELTVRFVRVRLDNDEYEVLVTSLLDPERYPATDFKELYWLRWGVETFYGILKTRLMLENFSGQSVEAIRQDFYAAVFLTGVETLLTEDANTTLAGKDTTHTYQANKAVSFNAIKYRAFDLFLGNTPPDQIIVELTQLFAQSATAYRHGRHPPRKQSSTHRILNFWKRQRKVVF